MGWGGVTADDDRGCYDPVLVFFFDVPVFDITLFYPKVVLKTSGLLPYSGSIH